MVAVYLCPLDRYSGYAPRPWEFMAVPVADIRFAPNDLIRPYHIPMPDGDRRQPFDLYLVTPRGQRRFLPRARMFGRLRAGKL